MKYSVDCQCGRTLPVEATQAGSTLVCTGCSQPVAVPRMSKLRVAVGETAIPLNSAERVRRAVQNGALPSNSVCPVTGNPTDALATFVVSCERAWREDGSQSGTVQTILFYAVFGWLGVLLTLLRGSERGIDTEAEIHGRENVVDAPLRVSTVALEQLARMSSQSKLRALLSSVPQYAELFEEYPAAEIVFIPAQNHK